MRVGDVVAGRYTIEGVLGRGGMSTVYRARDGVLERSVALKVLDDRLSGDPEYVERFRREARAIARLSHPNIVTVIDRGHVDACEFIVFELVRGHNLKELVAERGRLPVAEALALVHQAARGLAYAHENGIVHRDVKPQNVLVDGDGVAKVTDFGIARAIGPDRGLTQTGTILGTSDYLSPEQAVGQPVDQRSDEYSLGVLLYELLTGEVPYAGDNMLAVAMRHVHDPVPSVRERRPDVSARVDALVARAMAKQPADRFPTLDAFIGALEACLLEEGGAPRPTASGGATEILTPKARPAALRRSAERPRRRRIPWRLPVALLVVAVGSGLVWALATGRFDPAGVGGEASPAGVRLQALSDWDPEGGDGEHPELVSRATDRDPSTYWTTETYGSFAKSGVGIVLDARRRVELGAVTVVSDTPGFTARIQAGTRPGGPFEDVSDEQEAAERTRFRLDTGGEYRYYVVWITALDEVARLNEVRAG